MHHRSVVVLDGITLCPDLGNGTANHPDPGVFRYFHFDLRAVVLDPRHFPDNTAGRYNRVTTPDIGNHLPVGFHALLLWPEQKEIEDDDHQQDRHQLDQKVATTGAPGCCVCW